MSYCDNINPDLLERVDPSASRILELASLSLGLLALLGEIRHWSVWGQLALGSWQCMKSLARHLGSESDQLLQRGVPLQYVLVARKAG